MRHVLLTCLGLVLPAGEPSFSWQQPQAEVLPQGDLRWQPQPFRFAAGREVRYIDHAGGDDAAPGSRAAPWKHHPWDPEAVGNAKAASGPLTYVFRRGVVYRGRLIARAAIGTAEEPIRLTSDPAWGEGEAVISGSLPVTGWTAGGDARMPESAKVWSARLDYLPRRVFVRSADGSLVRLRLARHPNWEPQADDQRAQWWTWENPEWWTAKHVVQGKGFRCIDTRHLTEAPEFYQDALVWTEWIIMMGSPYPTKVESFDAATRSMVVAGFWWGDSTKVATGNRYYLEDKPHYLDQAGEFWFDRQGQGGILHVRLPGDADPNQARVEAARHSTLLAADRLEHVAITGLTFQGGNTHWDLTARTFVDAEVESAGIRLLGGGGDVVVANCRFDHLTGGVRIKADKDDQRLVGVRITDNQLTDLDRFGIHIGDSSRWAKAEGPFSTVDDVAILRNRIADTGLRTGRDCHGHVITSEYVDSLEVAGNIISRVGGSGIFLFGGKGGGQLRDRPYSRTLVHHNKVSDALRMSNDWGAIETWQGGPHYVWSNVSDDPGGYWHWSAMRMDPAKAADIGYGTARQGYAYYFDGSFKNYVFNNIAEGRSNGIGDPRSSACAFMEVHGFQNAFFNNTAHRFNAGVRRQSPRGGRSQILGNVYEDMSMWNLLLTAPRGKEDVNAYQMQNKDGPMLRPETLAVGGNVFAGRPREFGAFAEDGERLPTAEAFTRAYQASGAVRADVGAPVDGKVLADAPAGDYRLRPGSAATGAGVRFFVPWALSAVVGEWHFTPSAKDPATVLDDHWYMTPYYLDREAYFKTPRNDLTGVGITAASYVDGQLEDWTRGALQLDGKAQHLVARHADMTRPFAYEHAKQRHVAEGLALPTPDIGAHNLLIEVHLRTAARTGTIVSKVAEAGYALELVAGRPSLRLRSGGLDVCITTATTAIDDGAWHHLVAEFDRTQGVRLYLDGVAVPAESVGGPPAGSLANAADLLVGGGPGAQPLAGAIDFLRICRGTLAEARTTIAELHAWQSDGPALRDFRGSKPSGRRDAGALHGHNP